MSYTGQPIVDWVLTIAGNILIIVLVYNAIQYFAQKAWGAMAGLIAAAVVVGSFVWANAQTITFLKWIISQFFGA
ncbi:hypothetical protein [Schaalia cardiffensis]|uniref:hypothetical protein n=1 Tax=Schaalia cardiffensis TaxID=181487 RepID=UPI0023F3A15E|nr:hypothetical protein [Schaalia cardiffensis]